MTDALKNKLKSDLENVFKRGVMFNSFDLDLCLVIQIRNLGNVVFNEKKEVIEQEPLKCYKDFICKEFESQGFPDIGGFTSELHDSLKDSVHTYQIDLKYGMAVLFVTFNAFCAAGG